MDLMFGVHWHLIVTPPLVQMEYLQNKEHFPFKTVIIDDSLQITLVKKKSKCHLEYFWFDYLYSFCSQLHGSYLFSLKIFHLNKGRTLPKGANEAQTLDPFIESGLAKTRVLFKKKKKQPTCFFWGGGFMGFFGFYWAFLGFIKFFNI